jgi:glycosyltransferase involved in cell wall biosynthesis
MVSSFAKEAPLVTVIIPNYNYAHYIVDAIESVLRQTYPNLQIIVVDDGSTDNSLQVLKSYPDVIVLSQDNKGVSSARNMGLRYAAGQYIAFLDADDVWCDDKIQLQVDVMAEKSADLVSGVVEVCDNYLRHLYFLKAQFSGDLYSNMIKNPGHAFIPLVCSNALIRKSVIIKEDMFNPTLHTSADWDFLRKLSPAINVASIDDVVVKYRTHQGSMSSTKSSVYYKDNLRALLFAFKEDSSVDFFLKLLFLRGCISLFLEWLKAVVGRMRGY